MFSLPFLGYGQFPIHLHWADTIIQDGQQKCANCCGTSSINHLPAMARLPVFMLGLPVFVVEPPVFAHNGPDQLLPIRHTKPTAQSGDDLGDNLSPIHPRVIVSCQPWWTTGDEGEALATMVAHKTHINRLSLYLYFNSLVPGISTYMRFYKCKFSNLFYRLASFDLRWCLKMNAIGHSWY